MFLLTYGDGLANVNILKLIQFHLKEKKLVTVTAVNPPPRFGEITIKNSRSNKIEIDIEDQLPLTYDKNVTIERKEISGAKYDEVTGILKWRSIIQAKDSKKLSIVYQVKAPKTMPVVIN